ncbi:TPA: DnaD domain protein [Clostridium botulinum]|nr:DnaD domain protein [Clostridium botulinum]
MCHSNQSEILKHCTDKRDNISKAINELESAGYIERVLRRDSKGKLLGGYYYNIFEIPQFTKDNSEACTKLTESGKVEIADESDKYSYKYIKGILENWKINGVLWKIRR